MCWANDALHWHVLQNVMKMVETKECAEADQPEVRSTCTGCGDPLGSLSLRSLPLCLPQLPKP